MLKRKVEKRIKDWIANDKRALLVSGARQVGKTYIIRECLKQTKRDYLEINLINNPEYIPVMSQSTSVEDLITNISTISSHKMIKKETILFIDEIQECKDLVTKIKFWVDDNNFKYILSGSLLGVELRSLRSAPVGYITEIKMFPMDFEEFLIASEVPDDTIEHLKNCYINSIPINDVVNDTMFKHMYRYLVVGGMPQAVMEYINSSDIGRVTDIQQSIIEYYKHDFTKYESENKKLLLVNVFDQIPSQLLKQNKRFNYSDIKKKLRFERLENSFLWLSYSGVAIPVYNATEPKVSLNQNTKSSLLKLYSSDVGLLTCQYGNALRSKILTKDNDLNLGGVYENFIAQELNSHKFNLYFYNSHKYGELDFVIEKDLSVIPIEVKSGKDYYVHSAISNVTQNPNYGIKESIVFARSNIQPKGKIKYLPDYMVMFLSDNTKAPVLDKI